MNWRPVFWDGVESPREVIKPYVLGADIVKLSEEEAEWLLGIPGSDALEHPCKVGACSRPCLLPLVRCCRRPGPRARPATAALRLRQVLEQLPDAKGVLVTAGALGSAYCFRGSGGKLDLSGRVPVLRVQVQDTTGAGDAFLAGFLYSMVQARSPPAVAEAEAAGSRGVRERARRGQAGGLEALRADADKLRAAVEFATACGAFTTTKPGAIGAQPSEQQVTPALVLRCGMLQVKRASRVC